MSISLIIFGVIHLFVLLYIMELLRRISGRSKEYPLVENRVTLPFGFIKLKHVVIIYLIVYFAWIALSFWLYSFFI